MLTRRDWLRLSAGLSIALPSATAASSSKKRRVQADNCIILFLNGGPSHLDMWDMKPTAPAETRGEFKPISTSLPGVQFSEHLPLLSKQMHRSCLVRSMHHSVNNSHAAAVYVAMTGHDRGEQGGGFKPTDNPPPGSVVARLQPTTPGTVPYVALPYKTKEGAKGPPQPGFFAGWLGAEYDPLWVLKDPNAKDFSVPELDLRKLVSVDRLKSRGALLKRLNAVESDTPNALLDMDRMQAQALDLLTSSKTREAFRIDQEPTPLREAYGRNIYGQSTLLARRLIEAGTRVVTLSWAPDANATWDTHSSNFKKLKKTLLPQFDSAAATLISDLSQRGMLDRTLVAILGDFGRTPKINKNDAGRDHWNFCYTVMLAGGGIRPGFVYGASDRIGAFPKENPVRPGNILATIYHLLGVDHEQELHDRFRRPHQLVKEGQVLDEIIL